MVRVTYDGVSDGVRDLHAVKLTSMAVNFTNPSKTVDKITVLSSSHLQTSKPSRTANEKMCTRTMESNNLQTSGSVAGMSSVTTTRT